MPSGISGDKTVGVIVIDRWSFHLCFSRRGSVLLLDRLVHSAQWKIGHDHVRSVRRSRSVSAGVVLLPVPSTAVREPAHIPRKRNIILLSRIAFFSFSLIDTIYGHTSTVHGLGRFDPRWNSRSNRLNRVVDVFIVPLGIGFQNTFVIVLWTRDTIRIYAGVTGVIFV